MSAARPRFARSLIALAGLALAAPSALGQCGLLAFGPLKQIKVGNNPGGIVVADFNRLLKYV
jgi:hypothetical protein